MAVLVDGDNLSHDLADQILEHAAQLGPVTLRRVYGNMVLRLEWDNDTRFKSVHARGERSKNNADIRLVIDAMELALSGRPHSFVIASGDSDFAPLAERLREAGHLVVGIGGEKTSAAFRMACSQFQRVAVAEPPAITAEKPGMMAKQPEGLGPIDDAILRMMRAHGEKNVIAVALLGSLLHKFEGLNVKTSGHSSWTRYLKTKTEYFVVQGSGDALRARPLPILANLP